MFYIWLAVIILLVIMEIISINLTAISFIISGILTLFLSLLVDNFIIQISIFVFLGIVLQVVLKPYLIDFIESRKEEEEASSVILATVTKEISKNKVGEVSREGKFYDAYADKKIKVGKTVSIIMVEKTRLKVEEYEEEN